MNIQIFEKGQWNEVEAEGRKVGGFGMTTYRSEALRWYWVCGGTYGYAETREKALDNLKSAIPVQQAIAERCAKMPPVTVVYGRIC